MTVKELESELLALTFAEKMQVLQVLLRDFASIWTGVDQPIKAAEGTQEAADLLTPLAATQPAPEAFEALADQLADEFLTFAGTPPPTLSDYVVSCTGIYEEHP
jgi:hypothetical protein